MTLRPARHAGERKHEAGQQDGRQEEEKRHLHRLQLVLRERGERDADGQVGGDEQQRRQVQRSAELPSIGTSNRPCGAASRMIVTWIKPITM